MLYSLIYHQWSERRRTFNELWPLSIDEVNIKTTKDLVELYKKPVEDYYKSRS
jgi:hypothetical protein